MFDQPQDTHVSGNFFGTGAAIPGAENLKCGDLFAGAGGFSLAAQNIGLDVRFSVESDRHACDTYRSNLVYSGRPIVYERNISHLAPKIVERESFKEGEECDIILGGPPCQGFSVHRINNAGKNDPRNKLIHRYFKFVSYFRPRVFIMENVPGILWGRHSSYLDRFYKEAADTGYTVHEPIALEAADFGVPQKRKRIFVLGVRDGISLNLKWPPCGKFAFEPDNTNEVKSWRSASEVFNKLPAEDDPNDVHMNHGSELVKVFQATPINGGSRHDSGRTLPCHEEHNGHKDVYGRIDPAKPGPTMTTACINPSKGRFVHPSEHHGITVREAARFQTFPDEFSFKGGLIAAGVQVGNAVPILLGEAVLSTITRALLSAK